jgi:putative transferase (TIGR04331 family)
MDPYMKEKALILSGITEAWTEAESHVFVGAWCALDKELSNVKFKIIDYHWADRAKFAKDYHYIWDLYNRVLSSVGAALNSYHGTKHSERYWELIIGPWLITIIPALFDRWECIDLALRSSSCSKVKVNRNVLSDVLRRDYISSAHSLKDDVYNFSIFSEIILFLKPPGLTMSYSNVRNPQKNRKVKFSERLKIKLSSVIDYISLNLNPTQRVAIVTSYIGKKSLFSIFFGIGQLPNWHKALASSHLSLPKHLLVREDNFDFFAKNQFERFLSRHLINFIPASYLENFSILDKKASRYKCSPAVILTANSHISDDLFKIWSARQVVYNRTKLLISSHGGSLKSRYTLFTDYEEKVCHKRIVWHKPLSFKQVRLPANKLLDKKPKKFTAAGPVTLVGLDGDKYVLGMGSGPLSSLMLDEAKSIIALIRLCRASYSRDIEYYPYPSTHWNVSQMLYSEFGETCQSSLGSFDEVISDSSILICSYPQTTFAEAMVSGKPVVLLISLSYWELDSSFNAVLTALSEANILFWNVETAAAHINEIYDNPLSWWNSTKVVQARKLFFSECISINSNGADIWTQFLNHEVKS